MRRLCDDEGYGPLVRAWCQRSCGTCPPAASPPPSPPFPKGAAPSGGSSGPALPEGKLLNWPSAAVEPSSNGTSGIPAAAAAPNGTTTTSTCPAKAFPKGLPGAAVRPAQSRRKGRRGTSPKNSTSVLAELGSVVKTAAIQQAAAVAPAANLSLLGVVSGGWLQNETGLKEAGMVPQVVFGPMPAPSNWTGTDRPRAKAASLLGPQDAFPSVPNSSSSYVRLEAFPDAGLDALDGEVLSAQWASAAAALALWAPPVAQEQALPGEEPLGTHLQLEAAARVELPAEGPAFEMRGEHFFPAACAFRAEGAAADLPLAGSPYTMEAWVMPDFDIGHGGIVGWGDWGTQGAVQALRFAGPSRLKNSWWGNALVADAPASLADGAYHHVAATWDGSTRRMFVDFVEVAQQITSGYAAMRKDNFCVGQTSDNEHFRGRIKDLKIWRVALTAPQMRAEHQQPDLVLPEVEQNASEPGAGKVATGADAKLLPTSAAVQAAQKKERGCPPGFERVVGDVYGGDQFSGNYYASAESIEDCARRCAYTAGCGSFEFSPSRKRCYRNSQTRPTHDGDRLDFVFCRRAPCPSFKTEEACVGPSVPAAKHSAEVQMRPGSYCIWSGGACQAPMACTDKDCFLPDGGLPGMELPKRYTLWISRAGLQATMLPGATPQHTYLR